MTLARFALVLGGLSFLSLLTAVAVRASDTVSDADRAFVAKVSQGGMYEVELGKLAEVSAAKQDVKDQGNTEMHDHTLVGEKLKSITQANSIEFPSQTKCRVSEPARQVSLNAEQQIRYSLHRGYGEDPRRRWSCFRPRSKFGHEFRSKGLRCGDCSHRGETFGRAQRQSALSAGFAVLET